MGIKSPFLEKLHYHGRRRISLPNHNHHPTIYQLRLPLPPSSKPPTPPPIKPHRNPKNKAIKNKKKCSTSDILRLMDGLQVSSDNDIYASLIDDCSSSDSGAVLDLQAHLTRPHRLSSPPPLHLLNRLLLRHVSNGRLDVARHLFDEMPIKDFNSWTTLIAAYAEISDYDEMVRLFLRMLNQCEFGVDMLEFPAWIMACVVDATMDVGLGEQLHGCCIKLGHADHDIFVAASLINFYARLRQHEAAQRVSIELSEPNQLTWTSRITNNSRGERFLDVISDFREIGRAGINKNTCMFSCVLRACARLHDHSVIGRQVHASAIKLGVDSHSFVHCGLIDMYGRNGLLRDAKLVFQTFSDTTSTACWNAMLASYLRNGLCIEALKFLYEMKAYGLQPQEYLLDQVRIACASHDLRNTNIQEDDDKTLVKE